MRMLHLPIHLAFIIILSGCYLNGNGVLTKTGVPSLTQSPITNALPVLKIKDSSSASLTETDQLIVAIEITNDSNAFKWCLSPTQTAKPSATGSCLGGTDWLFSRPTTYTLSSGDGDKTLYMWIADSENNVNDDIVTATIKLDTTAPVITYNISAASPTSSTNLTISGTCTDSVGVENNGIKICIKSTSSCSASDFTYTTNCVSGTYSYIANLSQGLYDFAVKASDKLGNTSSAQGQGSRNYVIDNTPPSNPSFVNPSSNSVSGTTNYTFSWSSSDSGGSSLKTTNTYLVEYFASSSCTGSPAGTTHTNTGSYNYSGLVNLSTYSLRVTAYDNAGNQSSAICSNNVTVNTSAPTFTIADQTTSSNSHAKNSSVNITIGNDAGTAKWCVSQTQTTAPANSAAACNGGAGASSGWYTARPTTFSLSGADGNKTVYLWIADGSTAVTYGATSSIFLDTVIPVASISSGPNSSTNSTSANLVFTGTDTGGSGIASYECSLDGGAFSSCTSPKSYSSLAQGAHTVNVRATDNAGNVSSNSTYNWTIDTTAPVITITSTNPLVNTLNSSSFSGACETGSTISVSGAETGSATCAASAWSYTPGTQSSDSTRVYTFTHTDSAGNSSSVSGTWTRDTTAPSLVAGQMKINNGASSSNNNILQVSLQGTDSTSNITQFCLRYNDTTTPTAGDACWVPVNNPSPGLTPSTTLSLTNFSFQVAFNNGPYSIFAWLKDQAGNISTLTNSGAGTAAKDVDDIIYDPGSVPQVLNIIAANTSAPTNPPTIAELSTPAGTNVYIKWTATDTEGLKANPISLYYTTDDSTYTLIVANIANSANGCTVNDSGTTADDAATGCYLWTGGSPTNNYYKIQVRGTDLSGFTTSATSRALNVSQINFLAGNTDPGTNSSAKSAVFFPYKQNPYPGDPHAFVITPQGALYFNDDSRGILVVDPADGIQKIFIPKTGTISGDGGAATSATVRNVASIALDFQNRLLIYDYDRIRRVDLTTNIITTLIGGGNSTADGIAPTNVQFTAFVGNERSCTPLFPLPNGNVYFVSERFCSQSLATPANGFRIRVYDATANTVNSIYPSGTGSNLGAGTNFSNFYFISFGLTFDPQTSAINDMIFTFGDPSVPGSQTLHSIRVNPATGVAMTPHPPLPFGTWEGQNRFISRSGDLYAISQYNVFNRLKKFNPVSNTWQNIIGTGTKGICADGIAALSCNVFLFAGFVDQQNKIYVLDGSSIRTVDSNGNMYTLFGQNLDFGDGGLALNARFNDLTSFDQLSSGLITLYDYGMAKFREFTIGGTITNIAGDGSINTPNTTSLATNQGTYAWSRFWFKADPTTGDIIMPQQTKVMKLVRSTGKWQDLYGAGSTIYSSADGLLGSAVLFGNSYWGGIIGFNGSQVLMPVANWSGTQVIDATFKLYSTTDGTQTHLAGVLGNAITNGTICAAGTAVASCYVPPNSSIAVPTGPLVIPSYWDAPNNRWIIMDSGTRVTSFPIGGNVANLTTVSARPYAFTYRKSGTDEVIYFCDRTAQRLRKKNFTTGVETPLTWPITSMKCSGYNLIYNSTRDSLIFTYTQNGLQGVAEYLNPGI